MFNIFNKARESKHLNPKLYVLGSLAAAAVIMLVAKVPIVDSTLKQFGQGVSFRTRAQFKQNPTWHPKLKVYTYDDLTVSILQRSEPSIEILSLILKSVLDRNPDKIFIDKLFGYRGVGDPQQLDYLRSNKIPIVTSAIYADTSLAHREPLSTQFFSTDTIRQTLPTPWMPSASYAYGPHNTLKPYFHSVGHLNIAASNYIYPIIKIGNDYLPHWSLVGADNLSIDRKGIFQDAYRIPIDGEGKTLINVAPLSAYEPITKSMATLLASLQRKKALTDIEEGDTVALIMGHYSGKSTWVKTPAGKLPNSFLNISALNSALSNQWITEFGYTPLLTLLASAISGVCAFLLHGTFFWGTLSTLVLCWVGLAQFAFTFSSVSLPWVVPSLALVLPGALMHIWNSLAGERKVRQLRQSLEGLVEPAKLARLTKKTASIQWKASLQSVSIMFVDIVGFSKSIEKKQPTMVFKELKRFLSKATEIVHSHGGIVDKTLGDGVLAFFGYEYDGHSSGDHADQAVRCAEALSQMALDEGLNSVATKESIYPIRIGIHTDEIFVGDLGGSNRVDFTIVGNGVNFAKRCEEACEAFRIILSDATRGALSNAYKTGLFLAERSIQIKHHDMAFSVWELRPFSEMETQLQQVMKAYRKQTGLEREETRHPVNEMISVKVHAQELSAELLNYSHSGFALFTSGYLGIENKVKMRIPKLSQLPPDFPQLIELQVRWGQPYRNGFMHGLRITNLSESEKSTLFEALKSHRGTIVPAA